MTIACFTDAEWQALAKVAEHPEWARGPRFKDLAGAAGAPGRARRSRRRVDDIARRATRPCSPSSAPACRRASARRGNRCDHDPQLAALAWLTEVTGTKIGRWPLAEVPIKMSESPAHIGGRIHRGAPGYGEDNDYVYGELLGDVDGGDQALAEEGVI